MEVQTQHGKNKTAVFREWYTSYGCETKTGVVRILVIFQDRPMFSHTFNPLFSFTPKTGLELPETGVLF